MQKRLIEHDLPLAGISEASAREKNIRHGHPSTLHIWWARRPLASSRATAFAALIDDPGDDHPQKREELLELIKKITPWEAVKGGNSKDIERARQLILEQYGRPPRVLDPFAGGGSIPLEALRLGCETYASDYNPVAVFIEKATLEWPQKFGIEVELPESEVSEQPRSDALPGMDGHKVNLLAYLVEKWANIILEEARAEIGRFYPADEGGWIPVGYLWARTIPCQNPTCGAEIPLIKQFWLARKDNKKIAYRPVVNEADKRVDFEILPSEAAIKAANFDPGEGTVTRADARCLVCGQVTKANDTRRLAREGEMGERLVAVVLHHPDQTGKKYRLATAEDERIFAQAAACLEEKLANWPYLESPLPDEPIPTPDGQEYESGNLYYNFTPVVLYGMTKWGDLFNPRQQLALVTFIEKLKGSHERVRADCVAVLSRARVNTDLSADELVRAVMGYLAVMLSRVVDFDSTLCVLNSVGGRGVVHTFGRQALPMTWDYMESNVFNPEGASWYAAINQTDKVLQGGLHYGGTPASCAQQSANTLSFPDDHFDAMLTDPPYYDNVPYAALSDFFYVWLKRTVGDIHPELFSTPISPKHEEAIAELPLLRGMQKEKASELFKDIKSSEDFESLLKASFKEMYRVLKPGGVAVIVYAHKTTTGWEAMLNGLVGAGLVVTASWPIHTEKKGRLREIASAALASSIYMVCRKMEREPLGFWNELQPQIQERVERKLAQFWAGGVAGGDFFIFGHRPWYGRVLPLRAGGDLFRPAGWHRPTAGLHPQGRQRLPGAPPAERCQPRSHRQRGPVLPDLSLDVPGEPGALRRRPQNRQRRRGRPGAVVGQGQLCAQARGRRGGAGAAQAGPGQRGAEHGGRHAPRLPVVGKGAQGGTDPTAGPNGLRPERGLLAVLPGHRRVPAGREQGEATAGGAAHRQEWLHPRERRGGHSAGATGRAGTSVLSSSQMEELL